MTSRKSKPKLIEIPFLLSEAVKNGRAILFLGAGASKECKNAAGETPPNADQLRDILSQKFFGKNMPKKNVMSVAEMAIDSAGGSSLVFEAVNSAFQGFDTSDAHSLISDFNWRTIATTNYDNFVESAYSDPKRRRQTLIPFVKDDEPVDERMGSSLHPLQLLKLHGCLNHRLDKDIPLVLSWEQYASYSQNRTRLFNRLSDLAHECPVVFVGYGLGDSHIRDLIYRLEQKARPRWYLVDPEAEDEDIKFWSTKNFDVLKCRFGEFMTSLDEAVPRLFRFIKPSTDNIDFPLRHFYSSRGGEESDLLRGSLERDLTLVHASMAAEEQSADRFYSGYDTGWGCIVKRFDARRKVTDDLLYKALLENEAPTGPVFLLLKGPAGAGKTIALKRAAFDAATAHKALVLWLEESGHLRPEVFYEIADLTQQPIYLFVDQVALQVDKLVAFMSAMKTRQIPVVLVGAEREADWGTYCAGLQSIMPPQSVRVGTLSQGEIESLLDLLDRHGCLGDLKHKSRSEQVDAFAGQEQADRQLLVALHVLTRGLPFEKIVLNEYLSVNSEQARRLYLDIASLNQFGVPVRAGTISRISGIDFDDYQSKFFSPLIDMVALGRDPYTQDVTYRTRHIHVAQILFRQVFEEDASKVSQFVRIIQGLDVGYSSDSRVLEGICKGRTLTDNFHDAEGVREVFQTAVTAAPRQAYLYQQWAIFESTHPEGDFLQAEFYAETASWMQPKNSTFIHTRAEVARKRANVEDSVVLKDQLRRRTRAFLAEMPKADRFRVSSRCKLLVDELGDLTQALEQDDRAHQDQFYAEKLKDTEDAISRAQQDFPDDAEMFEIEARLWGDLKDKVNALKALERAWQRSPRGTGTAIRLGKIYATLGREGDRYNVLKEALAREPEDKAVHFAIAMHFLDAKPQNLEQADQYLQRCYSADQSDYEALFMLGQVRFARGDMASAHDLFDTLRRKAPPNFRRFPPRQDNSITSQLPTLNGRIESVKEQFCFIRTGAYPSEVFAGLGAFSEEEAEAVDIGVEVTFRVRFSRRGPTAVSVEISGGKRE